MKKSDKPNNSAEELRQLYGKDYVEKFLRNQSPFRLERLIQHIDLNNNYCVADFACGNGMLMPFVAPKVASYIGVDFSSEFIEEANTAKLLLKINNAEFICSEIKEFCHNHVERFDCAFAMDFSEHVPDDQWLEILSGIKISLKPGGILYLHTPNALFFAEIMKDKSFLLKQLQGHIAVRSPEENIQLLVSAGYSIKKLFLMPHYNLLKVAHIFSYIPIIGKYFKARIFIAAEK